MTPQLRHLLDVCPAECAGHPADCGCFPCRVWHVLVELEREEASHDYRWACKLEPEVERDLAVLPERARWLVCSLGFEASGAAGGTWYAGIHLDVLRVAREGRSPGKPGVGLYGPDTFCRSAADDPRGLGDAELEKLRRMLG